MTLNRRIRQLITPPSAMRLPLAEITSKKPPDFREVQNEAKMLSFPRTHGHFSVRAEF
jgi:hypothetical protein